MSNNQKTSGFHYGYVIVVACCILMMTSVTFSFSTASIFFGPVSKTLGVGKAAISFYMTVQCLAMTLALPFVGRLVAKRDMRVILTVCVLMVSGSLIAMSRFNALYDFYVSGFIIGVANAVLLYLTAPTLINRWFRTKVGTFIGLIMAFTGIGGVIFNPIGGYLISTYDWRTAYLVFGLIALIAGLPVTLFAIRSNPSDKGLLPYGEAEAAGDAAGALVGVSSSVALRSSTFYILAVFAGLISFMTTMSYFFPTYVTSLGMSITIGASMATALMLGQTLGKIFLGMIFDKSTFTGMSTGICFGILGIVTLLLFAKVGIWVILLAAFLYGVCYSGATVSTPLLTRAIFGGRDYSQIYSSISMVAALCSAFGFTIWGLIVDATGSYTIVFLLTLGILVVAFLLGSAALKLGKKFIFN
jgi:Cyanate permease